MQKYYLILGICFTALIGFAEKPIQGLALTYSILEGSDTVAVPNVWLYVPEGQTPTPFLPPGKFQAVWNGFLNADRRGDYSFQADLNGTLKLEINGTNVLDIVGANSTSELSKPVRLKKGTNAFIATFLTPKAGAAFVRLQWKLKDNLAEPIPQTALTHVPGIEEQGGKKYRLGRELFLEHRCLKCHTGVPSGMPELDMDAPSLEEIGSRRNQDWMARWISDPKLLRSSAHMPKFFSNEQSVAHSEAIAAYLATLKSDASNLSPAKFSPKKIERGKLLFESQYCSACHNAPDSSESENGKIPLKSVREKFPVHALLKFLEQPDLHYAWIRMPQFRFSDEQRADLAAYLLGNNSENPIKISAVDQKQIDLGKMLLQTSGCLNCHSSPLENRFTTKTLAQLTDWKTGCLAENPGEKFTAPEFNFSAEKRDALRTFATTVPASLTRHVPAEFAERQSRNLNCAGCHSTIEGIPRFEVLGGKLKPEWAAKFIAGEISDKPRPWIGAQMPAFPKHAQLLAEGLAMQYGLPPKTPVEPAVDEAAVAIGRNLVSVAPHGFSCVSCHAVGKIGAAQVFEAPGINLAESAERLQPAFAKRWLFSPSRIDPATKMPTYFDEEGGSPLIELYEGDGAKQIDAMWQYLRLGDAMPPPINE